MELMNGGQTNTPDDPGNSDNIQATYEDNNGDQDGRHESEEFYLLCDERSQQYGISFLILPFTMYSLIV